MQKYLLLNIKHFSVSNASPFLKKNPSKWSPNKRPLINRKTTPLNTLFLQRYLWKTCVVDNTQTLFPRSQRKPKKCVNKSCDTDPLSTNISQLQIFQDKFLLGLLSIGPTDFTNSLNVSYLNAPLFLQLWYQKKFCSVRFLKLN